MEAGDIKFLTSGFRVERAYDLKDGLRRLVVYGIRGGYVGILVYRDEDVDKIVDALKSPSLPREERRKDEPF